MKKRPLNRVSSKYTLGYLQRKHERWAYPLVRNGYLRCYLMRITGGVSGKPTQGVNICFYNVAEAVQVFAPHMEPPLFASFVGG